MRIVSKPYQGLSILIIIGLLIIISACTASRSTVKTTEPEGTGTVAQAAIVTVDADRFHDLIETSADAVLLDVRTPEEFQQGHIPGALLIPVQELETRIEELAAFRDKELLVYCRSGNRSLTAAKMLEQAGFTMIYNLGGGINSYSSSGYPIE